MTYLLLRPNLKIWKSFVPISRIWAGTSSNSTCCDRISFTRFQWSVKIWCSSRSSSYEINGRVLELESPSSQLSPERSEGREKLDAGERPSRVVHLVDVPATMWKRVSVHHAQVLSLFSLSIIHYLFLYIRGIIYTSLYFSLASWRLSILDR